jgi:hypothetical protein
VIDNKLFACLFVVKHGVESGVYFGVESGVTFGVESVVTFGIKFGVVFLNSFQKSILFHLQK